MREHTNTTFLLCKQEVQDLSEILVIQKQLMESFLQIIFVPTKSAKQLFGIQTCFALFHLANDSKSLLWSWQCLDSDFWNKFIHPIFQKQFPNTAAVIHWHNPSTSAV